ncbi:MAG TPA: C25 family cysteine peptidase [Sedimentisphaerales bacterium]|nr:C25 family cysteine peptidase [Sedimentisphaerales bacterium]
MFKNARQKRLLALMMLILLTCVTVKILSGQSSNRQFANNADEKSGPQLVRSRLESNALAGIFTNSRRQPANDTNQSTPSANQISEQIQKPTFLIPAIAKQNKPMALIIVNEDDEWLIAVAAPAAAKIRRQNKTPILLKWKSEENPRQTQLLEQLAPVSGFCTILSSDRTFTLDQTLGNLPTYNIPAKPEPAETSLLLAGHYWQKADSVVIASKYEPEAVILGSALACHSYSPLIVTTGREQPRALSRKLSSLGVGRIIYVTTKTVTADSGISFPAQKTEFIGVEEAQKRLIEKLNARNIQNIVLFRVPEESANGKSVSWLASYLSLIHRAALVPCYSSDPLVAESKLESVIRRYSLRPRTITILGDYEAIGLVTKTTGNDPNAFEISAELCPQLSQDQLAEMGVGRIPLRQLWAASTLIAYGVARNHILGQEPPNVLMIANPSANYGTLPLCETISRATASEFKNLGIQTNEFYNVSCNNPLIRNLVGDSQFIIFEGHISDFSLFEDRSYYGDEEDPYNYEYGNGRYEVYTDTSDFPENHTDDDDDYSNGEDNSNGVEINSQELDGRVDSDYETFEADVHDQPDESSQVTDPCELEGMPLILIQSCHSLDDTVLDILTSGAVGIVGSKTNIHSASGSAFIKSFCDGLLYRSDTVGEAMRDAKNYLLCVGALKKARGHTQYAKVERVAYSFHLWGDPELRLYTGLQNSQKLKPVSGRFVEPDKISIKIPARRLPTSRTEKYFIRMFPGSEAAGILKRLKGKEIRRVAPIYFFRIPLPKGFEPTQYVGLKKSDDTTIRATFFVDSFKRFLYIVYFPEKEEKEQVFTLRFIKRKMTAGMPLQKVSGM